MENLNVRLQVTKYINEEDMVVLTYEKYLKDNGDYIVYKDSLYTIGFTIYEAKIGDTYFGVDYYGSFVKKGRGRAKNSVLEELKNFRDYIAEADIKEDVVIEKKW